MIARLALLALALAAARDDPLAGRTAGVPVQCIDPHWVQGPEVVDAHTILYRQDGRRTWRTGPVGACAPLGRGDGLVVEIWGGRLCANDHFRVLSAGQVGAAVCRFDRFTPYDKAP